MYTNQVYNQYTDTRYTTNIPTPLPTRKYTNITKDTNKEIYNQDTTNTINLSYTQRKYTDITKDTNPNQYIIIPITNTNIHILGSWFIPFSVYPGVFRKSQEHTHLATSFYTNTIALKI